jgi:PilZ domain-containing protein
VPDSCAVIIGHADRLPALKEKVGGVNGEVLEFTDNDALRALEVIVKRRPKVVTLERLFAMTPRGAALINRIKADPKLADAEIRVLSHDSDYSRVVPRTQKTPAAPALDQRGTRRAPRFKMKDKVTLLIEGATAALIDLSTIGAQVVSPAKLSPNQRVRVALKDEGGGAEFFATVAWTSFEIQPSSGPRYRAGIEFIDADPHEVDAFCARQKV